MFAAWREFRRGKRKKLEVQQFEFNLEDNLFALREALITKTYEHRPYQAFYVRDPKLRHIRKAEVRDRVLHQALFRVLYPIFDKRFIFDSYSCRVGKGTHRAVARLEAFARKASRNNRHTGYALKCDIRRFFDTVDQSILLDLLRGQIDDEDALWLVQKIIRSFETKDGKGLPLGNVTSQLFANIYLNELDQFAKHNLKEKHYIRYCDDFVILREKIAHLESFIRTISEFLEKQLLLTLHTGKIFIRKYRQGIDFLGYVALSHYCVLRTKTKRRMLRKISSGWKELKKDAITEDSFYHSLQSYLGILNHCKGFKVRKNILSILD